jgi:hypothetical protein
MGWANLLISSLRLMDSTVEAIQLIYGVSLSDYNGQEGQSADLKSMVIVDMRGYVANLWSNATSLV